MLMPSDILMPSYILIPLYILSPLDILIPYHSWCPSTFHILTLSLLLLPFEIPMQLHIIAPFHGLVAFHILIKLLSSANVDYLNWLTFSPTAIDAIVSKIHLPSFDSFCICVLFEVFPLAGVRQHPSPLREVHINWQRVHHCAPTQPKWF